MKSILSIIFLCVVFMGLEYAKSSSLSSPPAEQAAFTQSGTGAVKRTIDEKLKDGWVSVKDFGATGDGTTDDTAAIQAAIDTKRHVFFPKLDTENVITTYRITAPLVFKGHGQIISGESPWTTVISQSTAAEDCLQMRPVADVVPQGSGLVFSHRLENIGLTGVGSATSAGDGLDMGPTSGSDWSGDWVSIENVVVRGFSVGIRCNGVAQMLATNVLSTQNTTGMIMEGSAQNSHNLRGVRLVGATTGLELAAGSGGVFEMGDMGNNTTDVHVNGGSGVFIGGNWESSDRVFDIESGSSATVMAARFLRSPSETTSPIIVRGNSKVVVLNVSQSQHTAGTALVEKASTIASVEIFGGGSPSSNFGTNEAISDNSQIIAATPFQSRYYNSIPSASSSLRGKFCQQIGLSGVAEDALLFFGLNRSGSVVKASLTPTLTINTWDQAQTFNGNFFADNTITAAATTGAQTINKNAGSVNFAAAATSLVVTNARVDANSVIIATVATNDATMTSVQAVAGAGSFTLHANAAATAETRVNFWIVN